jgi:hypothetical protein
MSSPTEARAVLDREFLDMRARLIDLAAALDRIDRATGSVGDDSRIVNVERALEILRDERDNRAEQIQLLFSRPYEPGWKTALGVNR